MSYISLNGMKWAYLINLSTMTIIELYIIEVMGSFDLNNFVMKSIVISFHGTSGRGITVVCLYVVYIIYLLCWHYMHLVM